MSVDFKTVRDIVSITETMTEYERCELGADEGLITDFAVYCNIHYENNRPVGFIILEDYPDKGKDKRHKELNILIGTIKEYRRKGIAKNLLRQAFAWFSEQEKYNLLIWHAAKDNKKSRLFAEKYGFVFGWDKFGGRRTVYIITNPAKHRILKERGTNAES